MRLFRLLTTLLVLAIVVLFIRQNLATFRTTVPFTLDLYIREKVLWHFQISTIILVSACLGFLVGFFLMLRPYMRLRKSVSKSQRAAKAEKSEEPVQEMPDAHQES